MTVVFTWRRAENLGLAVIALGFAILMLIPVAVHLYLAEDVFTDENLPLFFGSFVGIAIILLALILGMVQEGYVHSGEGKITTSGLLTVVTFLSFIYLGTYLGLMFGFEYLEEDLFAIGDLVKEIRTMQPELRFLLFQTVALCITYAFSILVALYARYSSPSE
ncbi:MAG: hypothetical protein ACFFB3_06195 [Candidatus Hodarchaeota archaeon]